MPEVDGFLGVNELLKVGDISKIKGFSDDDGDATEDENQITSHILADAGRPYFLYDDTLPRELSTQKHTAYVKVSEGCNRPCTFCIIPRIRGTMRSRKIDSVLKEVETLNERGVREINLVAQDLTAFGSDFKSDLKKYGLLDLLQALNIQNNDNWIRLLYAYPIGVTEALIESIYTLPAICEYIDIPLQHASENILKKMHRPIGKYTPRNVVKLIKDVSSEVAIRTTFIVGFPGETEDDIKELEDFVSEGHFSSVGVFTYSKESGTPSYNYEGHLSEKEKRKRRNRIMKAQQKNLANRLKAHVGKTYDTLIEGTHEDTDMLLKGRTRLQAPEVDGSVIINDIANSTLNLYKSSEELSGKVFKVKITDISGYDLVGTLI